MQITINNWDKYNPRKDVKNPSWFGFSNRMIEDSDIYDLDDGEFRAWVYCLSRASQANSETVKIDPRHALRVARVTESSLNSMVEKLANCGCINLRTRAVRARTEAVRGEESHGPDKQTNKQTDNKPTPAREGVLEVFVSELTRSYIETVKIKTQKAWFQTFPDETYVVDEINSACIWLTTKPDGHIKNFGGFFSNWLKRNWAKHRENISTSSAEQKEREEALERLIAIDENNKAQYQAKLNGEEVASA